MKLKDKVALITGGVSGIGRETAILLAKEGAHSVLNYTKSEAEAKEAAAAVKALGCKAMLYRADVSNDAQVSAMVEEAVKTFGRLDILVNSAGATTMVPFKNLDGLTEEAWDRMYAVNVKGVFFSSRAAAKVMLSQGSGCIVNVSSMGGLVAAGSSIAYAATKAAVVSLTKTMAVALAPNIRVNCVAPSIVNTRWNASRPEALPRMAERTPLKRVAEAHDVAEVILSLIASASFVTGQTIAIDGGQYLG
jgi:3-oxoacyl-[acyl-carrier protein] reductase